MTWMLWERDEPGIIEQAFVECALTDRVIDRVTALEALVYGEFAYDTTYALLLNWTVDGVREYERLYGTDELLFEIERVIYGMSDALVFELYEDVVGVRV